MIACHFFSPGHIKIYRAYLYLSFQEEKQRTLLQLQWKVMDEKSQQNDVEVNSKKVHNEINLVHFFYNFHFMETC